MIIVMQPGATAEQIEGATNRLGDLGFQVHRSDGETYTTLGAVGATTKDVDTRELGLLPGVDEVFRIARPFKLVYRGFRPEGTVIDVKGVRIGGDEITIMAGPCAVESREQIRASAAAVRAHGATVLRGGAFKPRTSPYSFQGMGVEGLKLLREAADEQGMLCITELMDPRDLEFLEQYADILQIGARNMQNFRLLAAAGGSDKPVFLKRGLAATLEELLMAAEYIVANGNPKVILCERGVRTFEPWTRNTFDLSAIPVLKKMTHLPVIADPSHATGVREYVAPMARAAIAAGAHGLMIEVHPEPEKAMSDGPQSLHPPEFAALVSDLRIIASTVGKHLPARPRPDHQLEKPLFDKALVLGMGLIGSSLALALRKCGAVGNIVGVDLEANLETVRAADVVSQVFPLEELDKATDDADLVILAAPVRAIIEVLPKLGSLLDKRGKKGGNTLVTDVGGTKVDICNAAASLPEGVHFIGGHPMAGSERQGPTAANPHLFVGAPYLLCPAGSASWDVVDRLSKALRSIGAHPEVIEPNRHDKLVAAVSHVPHLVAAALSNSVGGLAENDELALKLAAGGFRDVTRTASAGPALWADILTSNRAPILERLEELRAALDDAEKGLLSEEALESYLHRAADHRARVSSCQPTPGAQHGELLVQISDEPGALATITNVLAREKINILEFSLLKTRLDDDALLRLGFADQLDTEKAIQTLRSAGHDVRVLSESMGQKLKGSIDRER